jgi:hypothetical protein
MKLNKDAILRTILLSVSAILLSVGLAAAQEFPLNPPLLPSGRLAGPPVRYFAAGGKWRNIQTLRFDYKPHGVGQAAVVAGWLGSDNTLSFTEKILTPYIEYGVQRTRYFGLVLGLSGFSVGAGNVATSTGVLTLPVRTPVRESLANRLDVTVVEFMLAGRSRYPMYGLGNVGVTFGVLFAPSPYRLTTRSLVVSTGGNVAPGTVLQDFEVKVEDTWFNFGLAGAADVEFGVERFFARGKLEWDWYFLNSAHKGTMMEAHFNPSGVAISLIGGVRF